MAKLKLAYIIDKYVGYNCPNCEKYLGTHNIDSSKSDTGFE